MPQLGTSQIIRFATFEVDLQAQELRKGGLRLKLTGQPFQVLAILMEQPGAVVTREELQKRLWPDTFVDVDHNLNTAINKIREALCDSAENPRFVETLPRRGYRFIGPITVNGTTAATAHAVEESAIRVPESVAKIRALSALALLGAVALLAVGLWVYKRREAPATPPQRTLTRMTFDEGLQHQATWSPDGRYIAYSSDRGGKFDIWVQQISGGDPIQITKGPGHHWQPDWSPDGKYIAYRSEEGAGGIYIVPALGGAGLERKLSSFGYFPRWSPDGARILFQTHFSPIDNVNRFYVIRLDGGPAQEVLAEFLVQHKLWPGSAIWHPDGRVTFWVADPSPAPSLWTVPLAGGPAIKSDITPAIQKELAAVATEGEQGEQHGNFSFSWSPSGDAVYFALGYRGAINIWKMAIDPQSLRATGINRLTTGPGPDAGVAVSPDGRRLAFTAKSEHMRTWLFPFDATAGRIRGSGGAITSPGRISIKPTLSRDGKNLAFSGNRQELWLKSMPEGHEAPLIADDYIRWVPQWSPDGMQLAYQRQKRLAHEYQLMVWSSQTHDEDPVTTPSNTDRIVSDWSPDGRWLLVSQGTGHPMEVWLLPLAGAPHAETEARRIISDPAYDFWQSHFSPNGRWIVFEAVLNSPKAAESTLYVMPAAGGPWTRIGDGKHWDDKPRWSPDGRTLYFVSERSGFFNVWGVRFDPDRGKPIGEPFRVTTFESPRLMVSQLIPCVEISLTEDKLVLTMSDASGNIWVLDNVDR